MTGGFSAEYANRFGGILDVVTKSGFAMNNSGSVTLGVGTALRHNASLEYGFHTPRAAYYVNASGFESARFLSPPDPRSIHNTGRGGRSFLQMEVAATANDFLKLVLMADGTNFQIPKTSLDDLLRPNLNSFQRTRSQNLILSWDHVFYRLLLKTSFYQKWSRSCSSPTAIRIARRMPSAVSRRTASNRCDALRGRHVFKTESSVMLRRTNGLATEPAVDRLHTFDRPDTTPVLSVDRCLPTKQTGGQASAMSR
jgi:hypothetical protein